MVNVSTAAVKIKKKMKNNLLGYFNLCKGIQKKQQNEIPTGDNSMHYILPTQGRKNIQLRTEEGKKEIKLWNNINVSR